MLISILFDPSLGHPDQTLPLVQIMAKLTRAGNIISDKLKLYHQRDVLIRVMIGANTEEECPDSRLYVQLENDLEAEIPVTVLQDLMYEHFGSAMVGSNRYHFYAPRAPDTIYTQPAMA